jgi:hypothetical protein
MDVSRAGRGVGKPVPDSNVQDGMPLQSVGPRSRLRREHEEKQRGGQRPMVERERTAATQMVCSVHFQVPVNKVGRGCKGSVCIMNGQVQLDLAPCDRRGAATLSIATTRTPPPSHKQKSWWHFISLLWTLHPDSLFVATPGCTNNTATVR